MLLKILQHELDYCTYVCGKFITLQRSEQIRMFYYCHVDICIPYESCDHNSTCFKSKLIVLNIIF